MLEWSYENYFEAYSETVQCMKAAAPNPGPWTGTGSGVKLTIFRVFIVDSVSRGLVL